MEIPWIKLIMICIAIIILMKLFDTSKWDKYN